MKFVHQRPIIALVVGFLFVLLLARTAYAQPLLNPSLRVQSYASTVTQNGMTGQPNVPGILVGDRVAVTFTIDVTTPAAAGDWVGARYFRGVKRVDVAIGSREWSVDASGSRGFFVQVTNDRGPVEPLQWDFISVTPGGTEVPFQGSRISEWQLVGAEVLFQDPSGQAISNTALPRYSIDPSRFQYAYGYLRFKRTDGAIADLPLTISEQTQSVARLSINTTFKVSPVGLFAGHAWIGVENLHTADLNTFGTFPYGGLTSGYMYADIELNDKRYRPEASREMFLTQRQYDALFRTVDAYQALGDGAWSVGANCTQFASNAWSATTGEPFTDLVLPSLLSVAIKTANDGKKSLTVNTCAGPLCGR